MPLTCFHMRLHSATPCDSLAEGLTNADRGPLESGRAPEGLVVVQRHHTRALYLCYDHLKYDVKIFNDKM